MSATPTNLKAPRILTIITMAVGTIMLILGVTVYAFASAQLSSQHISVAAVTAADPGPLAGKPVAGPITALAQINAISHHIAKAIW